MIKLNFNNDNSSAEEELLLSLVFKVFIWKVFMKKFVVFRLTSIKLQCKNELMKYVIDRFGEKVETEPTHDDKFTCYVNVRLSPTFYGWVFGFGGDIRILAPSKAVEKIIDMSRRMITAESI